MSTNIGEFSSGSFVDRSKDMRGKRSLRWYVHIERRENDE